jgi:hypothetical protein
MRDGEAVNPGTAVLNVKGVNVGGRVGGRPGVTGALQAANTTAKITCQPNGFDCIGPCLLSGIITLPASAGKWSDILAGANLRVLGILRVVHPAT